VCRICSRYLAESREEIRTKEQSCKNLTITEWLNHIEKKRDEIQLYKPTTTNLEELQKRADQDDIFQFLESLDSSYETLRSQILLSEDLPSFDKVANMVQREESRRTVMNPQSHEIEENKAFTFRHQEPNPNPNFGTTRRDRTLLRCEHCKREGHQQEECWFLHPELRPKGRGRGGGGGGFKGGKWRQGEQYEERYNKRVLGATNERGSEKVERVTANPSPQIKDTSVGMRSDPMRQLMEQLSVMLQ
jgi:hypothetical protein